VLDRLAAEALAALMENDSSSADVTLVVTGSRSALAGRGRRTWANAEVVVVERPAAGPARPRRGWRPKERIEATSVTVPTSAVAKIRSLAGPALAEQLAAVVGSRPQ
jgi:hypothetical protein